MCGDAAAELRQLGDRFGFNRSARARLGLTTAKGLTIAADLENWIGNADDTPAEITVEVMGD